MKLCSLWSIVKFLKSKEVTSYWEGSGYVTNLKEAFRIPIIKNQVEEFIIKP
jgi:hypothetical protein